MSNNRVYAWQLHGVRLMPGLVPDRRSVKKTDHGVVQDDRGQDQPKDKKSAQKLGVKEQKEFAKQQVESPGQPAGRGIAVSRSSSRHPLALRFFCAAGHECCPIRCADAVNLHLLDTHTRVSWAVFSRGEAVLAPATMLGLFFAGAADVRKMEHREPISRSEYSRQWRSLRRQLEYWRSSRCSSSQCLRVRYFSRLPMRLFIPFAPRFALSLSAAANEISLSLCVALYDDAELPSLRLPRDDFHFDGHRNLHSKAPAETGAWTGAGHCCWGAGWQAPAVRVLNAIGRDWFLCLHGS